MHRYRIFMALTLLASIAMAGPALADEDEAAIRGDVGQAEQAWELIGNGAKIIDVRRPEEFAQGHLEGAINVPHQDIEGLVSAIGVNLGEPVVLYCGSGRRAGVAKQQLENLGYRNVFNGTGLDAMRVADPSARPD